MTSHVSQRVGEQIAPSIEFGAGLVHGRFSVSQSLRCDHIQAASHLGASRQFQKGSRHAF